MVVVFLLQILLNLTLLNMGFLKMKANLESLSRVQMKFHYVKA